MKKILIDLDGTLIDLIHRYHHIHIVLGKKFAFNPLSKRRYFMQKRNLGREDELLSALGKNRKEIESIIEERKTLIQTHGFEKDRLLPGVEKTLRALAEDFSLHLVTYRRSRAIVMFQLKAFKLDNYFAGLHVRGDESYPSGAHFKTAAGKKIGVNGQDFIVGDTEDDVVAGKQLNIVTVAVTTGLRNRKQLQKLKPDYIINRFSRLITLTHADIKKTL